MGKFKNQGDPILALAEECAELIQVINKKYRFSGDSLNAWKETPTGKTESRLESLLSEIADVQYQIARTLEVVGGEHDENCNNEDPQDPQDYYEHDSEQGEYTVYCDFCEVYTTFSDDDPYGTCMCS